MKLILSLLMLLPILSLTCDKDGNSGFLPENKMWIGTDAKKINADMTEERFSEIIDGVVAFYLPRFEELGVTFTVNKLWDNGTVNASAQQMGNDWRINMYGGLARHELTTEDGFALVVCHELGHHLGGAPKYSGRWASNEGQSDYWATLKCFRNYVQDHDNEEIVANMEIPEVVNNQCDEDFTDAERRLICKRSAMGGLSLGRLLGSLRGNDVSFDTPLVQML